MMKRWCLGIMLWACALWGQQSVPVVLKNVNIVALGGGVDQTNRDVLLENGKIASIRPASNKPFPGIEQINAAGKWLVPGLIDLHVNLIGAAPDSMLLREEAAELLAAGVTTVLDLSGAVEASAEHVFPDSLAAASVQIFRACAVLPSPTTPFQSWPGQIFVKSEQEARQAVRTAQARNAQMVYCDPRLEGQLVKAVVQEAQASSLTSAGTALGYSFDEATRAGLNIIYDMNSLMSASLGGGERKQLAQAWSESPAALYGTRSGRLFFEAWGKLDPMKEGRKKMALLANRAVFLAPMLAWEEKRLQEYAHTTYAAQVQTVREKFYALLRAAFDLQVPLLIGSGYSAREDWRPTLQEEMEAWVKAGIAPRYVLEAATINAGHALRQQDLGQIGEGMRADVLVLEDHPFQNFATLRQPALVIQNGIVHTGEALRQGLDTASRAQREIRAVLAWQQQAWNDADLDRFMRGYWQSDSTVFASSEVSRGWRPMLERYRRGYPTPEKMGKLQFTIAQIDMMSPEWAKVLGAWELSGLPENPHGWFTLILRRFSQGWRIVHDHTSTAK